MKFQKNKKKLEKAGTVNFKEHLAKKVWVKVQGSVDPRFAIFASPRLEILEFKASRDSGKVFPHFSCDFPGVFFENPQEIRETATSRVF